MGIILGDIIDVEGDTEEANDLLLRMIDNVPHLAFRSSKSIHHLFRSPDPNLTRWCYADIEFRGHRHQSVVPPSIHEQGDQYRWLSNIKFEIPELPKELLDFYLKNKNNSTRRIRNPKKQNKEGYIKTECKNCKSFFFIHYKRLKLEVKAFRQYNLLWNCHNCRKIDVKDECRRLRK